MGSSIRHCRRVILSFSLPAARSGWTLVELLVTIAILGTLIGLLLPAIQHAREAGRYANCQSNLRQIALGLLLHHDSYKSFPHGGWGYHWVGVPERGSGKQQPGSWAYSILPFVGEEDLHDLGGNLIGPNSIALHSRRLQTPLPLFVCPSRRSCSAWTVSDQYPYVQKPKPFGSVSEVGRSDYAINSGSSHVFSFSGPVDVNQGDDKSFWHNAPVPRKFTGISHLRVAAPVRSIIDGASKTFLLGEKYVDPANYTTGASLGDNKSLYTGFCTDLHRFTGMVERINLSLPPYVFPLNDHALPDSGIVGFVRFGSAHPAGFNMVYCDGSICSFAYEIDPELFFRSGHRNDQGKPLESLD